MDSFSGIISADLNTVLLVIESICATLPDFARQLWAFDNLTADVGRGQLTDRGLQKGGRTHEVMNEIVQAQVVLYALKHRCYAGERINDSDR